MSKTASEQWSPRCPEFCEFKGQYTKHIQKIQEWKQNKSTPSEQSCTQKSVCFSSCISYICLESCLSKSCTQHLLQQPLLCPAQKVFFQPSTSKANIDVMIYLAIHPINAFTEGKGNSTSSKWNQLKNMNFTNREGQSVHLKGSCRRIIALLWSGCLEQEPLKPLSSHVCHDIDRRAPCWTHSKMALFSPPPLDSSHKTTAGLYIHK